MKPGDRVVVDCGKGFSALCAALRGKGFRLLGPTVRDGAIVYDEISSAADLPAGWTDEQEEGRYRLKRREDGALFGYAVGPHSWKRFLHVPELTRWRARRDAQGFHIEDVDDGNPTPLAFIGVRACELAAIAIQDRVFLGGPHVDSAYRKRRAGAFIVAVNCGQAGGTCFCASMKTGPRASSGFDLVLTELVDDARHAFLVEVGSERGADVASELPGKPASKKDLAAAAAVIERAEGGMGRVLETEGLKELFYRSYESLRWDDVARRCLACANCTMVCPTCFCATVEDVTDLSGSEARRVRRWDSCFTLDFSYVHGGSVRTSMEARYRQWITHKLATWQDQFGTSGCVGCGRCITWCPVGIDITAEARAIRDVDEQRRERRGNGDL